MRANTIWAIGYYYGWGSIKRGIPYTLMTLLMPLSLLFIFGLISGSGLAGAVGGGDLISYAILGGFISIVAGNALSTMSDASFWRLQLRIQDLLVATSMTEVEYMLGLGLSNIIFSLPGLAIYVAIAYSFHIFTVLSFVITLAILVAMAIATTALAFILSSIPSHMRNVWGMSGVLSLALTLVPPIFYPYTLLPKPLLYLFMLSPATPAAMLVQGLAGLQPLYLPAFYVLVAETLAMLWLAKRFTKWRQD